MDIEIITEEGNPMLHRTDVRFEVRHDEATPSRLSVRDSLAAQLNKDAEEVVVRELDTKFGMRKTVGAAKVYDGPAFAQAVEQDHMLQRNKIVADGEGGTTAEPAPEPEPAPDVDESEGDEEADVDEGGTEKPADEADEAEADDEAAEDDTEEPDETEADDVEERDDSEENDEAEAEDASDDGEDDADDEE